MAVYCLHDDILTLKQKQLNQEDVITFDDGCYSLYKYREILKTIPNRKILFITPSYIQMNKRMEEPDFNVYYQYNYRINGKSPWLTIYEIEDLVKNYNVELGMHSYYHDIVYVSGTTEYNRRWRMYKITTEEDKMKILCKMYNTKSALSTLGNQVLNGYVCRRNHNQFVEFIKSDTYLCVEWFKKHFGKNDLYAFPFFESSQELINELYRYGIKNENMFGKRLNISSACDTINSK